MTNNIVIKDLLLSGFRAYLSEQSFILFEGGRPKSLAVFAPNAKGKSSLVDAIEFFFSPDGTIKRLGVRRSGTHAGQEALEHVKAQSEGINSEVTIRFKDSSGSFCDTRSSAQSRQGRPEAANRVLNAQKVDFIIRGHELRQFVEEQTPVQRYQEVSMWFGLTSLVDIQRYLRELRLLLHTEVESDHATVERLRDLSAITSGGQTVWGDEEVLDWLHSEYLNPLDPGIVLPSLDNRSDEYQLILQRKKDEEEQVGLAALNEIIISIKEVYEREVPQPDGSLKPSGAIVAFEGAVNSVEEAQQKEQKVQIESAKAIFNEVWEAARRIFEDTTVEIDMCPVCRTPIDKTAAGSRKHVILHLHTELKNLREYSSAVENRRQAISALRQKLADAQSRLSNLLTLLRSADLTEVASTVESFSSILENWEEAQPIPDSSASKQVLFKLLPEIEKNRRLIEESQGDKTYAKALEKINRLINLKQDLVKIEQTRGALKRLHDSLMAIENSVIHGIRTHVQSVIDALGTLVGILFRAVHTDVTEAPNIYLKLDQEARQAKLDLLVDFATNRQEVIPGGYLSDSQMHTLALSLRLAAIQLFNKKAPIIVLDDIVNLYDADHRRAIAKMIADHFPDFQIILLTLDERFFVYLKEHLPQSFWKFKRITLLDPDFGPRFHDHNVPDTLIEDKLASDETAANEIRQAEEEWLLRICRDFSVDVQIRPVLQPYSYSRSELAVALYKFLKGKGIDVPEIRGISNPFLISLQQGKLENFGSHFQDDPNALRSIGDERVRWEEFKSFREMFVCPSCGRKSFKRPLGMDQPVCKACETPFTFQVS